MLQINETPRLTPLSLNSTRQLNFSKVVSFIVLSSLFLYLYIKLFLKFSKKMVLFCLIVSLILTADLVSRYFVLKHKQKVCFKLSMRCKIAYTSQRGWHLSYRGRGRGRGNIPPKYRQAHPPSDASSNNSYGPSSTNPSDSSSSSSSSYKQTQSTPNPKNSCLMMALNKIYSSTPQFMKTISNVTPGLIKVSNTKEEKWIKGRSETLYGFEYNMCIAILHTFNTILSKMQAVHFLQYENDRWDHMFTMKGGCIKYDLLVQKDEWIVVFAKLDNMIRKIDNLPSTAEGHHVFAIRFDHHFMTFINAKDISITPPLKVRSNTEASQKHIHNSFSKLKQKCPYIANVQLLFDDIVTAKEIYQEEMLNQQWSQPINSSLNLELSDEEEEYEEEEEEEEEVPKTKGKEPAHVPNPPSDPSDAKDDSWKIKLKPKKAEPQLVWTPPELVWTSNKPMEMIHEPKPSNSGTIAVDSTHLNSEPLNSYGTFISEMDGCDDQQHWTISDLDAIGNVFDYIIEMGEAVPDVSNSFDPPTQTIGDPIMTSEPKRLLEHSSLTASSEQEASDPMIKPSSSKKKVTISKEAKVESIHKKAKRRSDDGEIIEEKKKEPFDYKKFIVPRKVVQCDWSVHKSTLSLQDSDDPIQNKINKANLAKVQKIAKLRGDKEVDKIRSVDITRAREDFDKSEIPHHMSYTTEQNHDSRPQSYPMVRETISSDSYAFLVPPVFAVSATIVLFNIVMKTPLILAKLLERLIVPLKAYTMLTQLPPITPILINSALAGGAGSIKTLVHCYVSQKDGRVFKTAQHIHIDHARYDRIFCYSLLMQWQNNEPILAIVRNYILRWFVPHWFTSDCSVISHRDLNLVIRFNSLKQVERDATPALRRSAQLLSGLAGIKFVYFYYYILYDVIKTGRENDLVRRLDELKILTLFHGLNHLRDLDYATPSSFLCSIVWFFLHAMNRMIIFASYPFIAIRDSFESHLVWWMYLSFMVFLVALFTYHFKRVHSYYLPMRDVMDLCYYGSGPCDPSHAHMIQTNSGKEVNVIIPHPLPPVCANGVCGKRSMAEGRIVNWPGLTLFVSPFALDDVNDETFYWSNNGHYVDSVSGALCQVVAPAKSKGNHTLSSNSNMDYIITLAGLPPIVEVYLLNPATGLNEAYYQFIYYDPVAGINVNKFVPVAKFMEKVGLLERTCSAAPVKFGGNAADILKEIYTYFAKVEDTVRKCALDLMDDVNGAACPMYKEYLRAYVDNILMGNRNYCKLKYFFDPFHPLRTREDISPKHVQKWLEDDFRQFCNPLIAFTKKKFKSRDDEGWGVVNDEIYSSANIDDEVYYEPKTYSMTLNSKRRRKHGYNSGARGKLRGKALMVSPEEHRLLIKEGIAAHVEFRCVGCGGYAPMKFRWKYQYCPDCYIIMKNNALSSDPYFDPEIPVCWPDGIYEVPTPQCLKPVFPNWKTKARLGSYFTRDVKPPKGATDICDEPEVERGTQLVGIGSSIRPTVFTKLAPGRDKHNFTSNTELNMIGNRLFAVQPNAPMPNSWNILKSALYDSNSFLIKRLRQMSSSGEPDMIIPFRFSDHYSTTNAVDNGWVTQSQADEIERYLDDFDAHNYAGGDREQYRSEEQPRSYPHNRYREGRGWVHSFPPARQRELWMDMAAYMVTGHHRLLEKCKIFMKREKAPNACSYIAARCKSNPRCIICFQTVLQALCGRYDRSITEQLHEIFSPDTNYTYAGGLTPDSFDKWINKHLCIPETPSSIPIMSLKDDNRVIVMSDYSAFDTSIGKRPLDFWHHFCNSLGQPLYNRRSYLTPLDPIQELSGDVNMLGWVKRAWSRPRGQTPGGVKVKGPYMNCSGRGDTAAMNLFLNFATQYITYLHVLTGHQSPYSRTEYEYVHSNMDWIALGDDSLVFVTKYRIDGSMWNENDVKNVLAIYGFTFSEITVTKDPRQIVFLGQRPWFALKVDEEAMHVDKRRMPTEEEIEEVKQIINKSVQMEIQYGEAHNSLESLDRVLNFEILGKHNYSETLTDRKEIARLCQMRDLVRDMADLYGEYVKIPDDWEERSEVRPLWMIGAAPKNLRDHPLIQFKYVKRCISWAPILGRFMQKYGWRLDAGPDPIAWWKGINRAILASFPHLPITNEIAHRVLQLYIHHTETPITAKMDKEERDRRFKLYYRPRKERVFLDYAGSEALLEYHYGISPQTYEDYRRTISRIQSFPVVWVDTLLDLAQQKEAS